MENNGYLNLKALSAIDSGPLAGTLRLGRSQRRYEQNTPPFVDKPAQFPKDRGQNDDGQPQGSAKALASQLVTLYQDTIARKQESRGTTRSAT